jgi:hypothetical protein
VQRVLAESDRGLPGTVPVRLDAVVAEVLESYTELADEHRVTLRRGMVELDGAGSCPAGAGESLHPVRPHFQSRSGVVRG